MAKWPQVLKADSDVTKHGRRSDKEVSTSANHKKIQN